MFSPIGNGLGVSLPALFVTQRPGGSVHGMQVFMLAQVVVTAVPAVWAYFCLRSYPPLPPSQSTKERQVRRSGAKSGLRCLGVGADLSCGGRWRATRQALHRARHTEDSWRSSVDEVWREFRKLIGNRQYLIVLWSFGGGLAFFNALLTVISQLLQPCGYTEEESGTMGAIFLGAGLVAALLVGLLLDATHMYRPILKGGYLLAMGAALLFCFSQKEDSFGRLAVSFAVFGAVMLPLLPVSIENSVECTYPIPEIYSSGLLLAAGNLIGIACTFTFSALIDGYHGACDNVVKPTNVLIMSLVAVVVLPIFAFQGEYARLNADKRGSDMAVPFRVDSDDAGDLEAEAKADSSINMSPRRM
jgi:hypothetical protein